LSIIGIAVERFSVPGGSAGAEAAIRRRSRDAACRRDPNGHFEREFPMSRLCKAFLNDQSGATAIEYALMASLIAVVLIGVLTNLGTKMSSEFSEISGALK
jgi:pilus assembly protein Flp/PilA